MGNIRLIETGKRFGNMNLNKNFYPAGLSDLEIKDLFMKNRLSVGEAFGFDGRKMYMASQEMKNGSYFEITDDYVEAYPDGWTDISEDILIINDKVLGVVIGHPVADCPVIMMADMKKGVMAVAHCSASLIDKKMPIMVADALQDAYKCCDDDLLVYVGACAADTWTYDKYPAWALDEELWKDNIYLGEDNLFHINMRGAIAKQMVMRNLSTSHVFYNQTDTITNPNYYSNSLSKLYPDKAGRHFTGAFFKEHDAKKLLKK